MPDQSTASSDPHQQITKTIQASRQAVYQAFLEPKALEAWLPPDGMQCQVHYLEPREGGAFRISLMYRNPDASQQGKSDDFTDTYHGRFTQLIPHEKIVEVIEFESDDPGFAGEMTIIARLAETDTGTGLTVEFENIPAGIKPEDNTLGWQMSLEKLASLVE